MEASEFKFLLKLLGHQGYRSPLSKIDLEKKDKICQKLAERDIVGYSHEVRSFKIEPAGKGILKQTETELPIPETHLAVLKACETKSTVPSNISKKVPASERQAIIQELEAKGLIKAEKIQIKDVWLTEQGAEVLRDDFNPKGTATISFTLLANYLTFMRKSLQASPAASSSAPTPLESQDKPTDEEILQIIRELDQHEGTDNYLPIFYLRNKVQPPLSREELDDILYRLQRADRLEMSSLVESVHFTPEQIQAGIPQDSAGPLFFLILNE